MAGWGLKTTAECAEMLRQNFQNSLATSNLKKDYHIHGERLFMRACSDRTRGHSLKMKEDRLRLGVRKEFFTARVVRHWKVVQRGCGFCIVDGTLINLV